MKRLKCTGTRLFLKKNEKGDKTTVSVMDIYSNGKLPTDLVTSKHGLGCMAFTLDILTIYLPALLWPSFWDVKIHIQKVG